MSSETTGEVTTVKTEGAAADFTNPAPREVERKCPVTDDLVHRNDVRKIWRECQEESFWYRALPISLGSMAVTGGLIYNGIWKSAKRFGPFPKLAVAAVLGYAVGKASYVGNCRKKFQELGVGDGPGFGIWSRGGHMGPFSNSGHGHRSCNHVCEECKKSAQAALSKG
ncbi:OCIA domain-containing protein 2 isoform X2 [Echeneis naucrates]|uniref:OCIA domain-containing protein n=1 Tax=Echeneis naucrates TaxID=173247 RepID=A0A665T8Q9_ECHNA|nr:OCIA domain-containing protein 2 isoform X2 [Echeneis naucrates]